MRQTSPLSPAILLGATRLMIIGVNDPLPTGAQPPRAAGRAHIQPDVRLHAGFLVHGYAECESRAHQSLQRKRGHAAHRDAGDFADARRQRDRAPPRARTAARAAGAAARPGRAQRAEFAALELPAVRARLYAGNDRFGLRGCARARRGDSRVPAAGAGAPVSVDAQASSFSASRAASEPAGCDLRKCCASCSAMYTERCWPPVQPTAMVR